jgi:histidinol-phosphatase (PHP family)
VIADYHMHLRDEHEQIAHRSSAIDAFVETALARGVDEIGFSEHVYYFSQTRALWHVPYHTDRCAHDLECYVEAVLDAKQHGLPVKLGLEVDYEPEREEETRELLGPYPWDYLLGSVHFIDGLGVDGEPRLSDSVGIEEAWRRYFATLAAAARSGLFDSLSHPDLVKVFGQRPPQGLERELHAQVVDAIADAGVAVEVSTGGLRKPVGELYPDPHLLALCRERGVPATVASDAHVPSLVGSDFDRARALLRSAGYETITLFDRRQGRQVRFDD